MDLLAARTPRSVGSVALAARGLIAACAFISACGTVDVGPDTGPPEPCNAPPAFFVTDVWPKYFVKYSCGQSGCHSATDGRGSFRLQDVSMVTTPSPASPVSVWPFEWQQNLSNIEQNLSCADPLSSLVLSVPSGLSIPHPPGTTVTDIPGADTLFTTWL